MNKFFTLCAIATASIIIYAAYQLKSEQETPNDRLVNPQVSKVKQVKSSLDDDLSDVLAFVPFNETYKIIANYAMYHKQIGCTITFINYIKDDVLTELARIPELKLYLIFLRQNGLNLTKWHRRITSYWKSLPVFVGEDPSLASGGLRALAGDIIEEIPARELHYYLCQKVRYSTSLRQFLMSLKSQQFDNLCCKIENNTACNRFLHSALKTDVDVTYLRELFWEIHRYLTEIVLQQKEEYNF